MPTVSTYLKMMDQFSRPLQKVTNAVQTATIAMERLRRLVETPAEFRVSVDSSQITTEMNRVRTELTAAGTAAALHVSINSADIMAEISTIQARLREGLAGAAIPVTLDGAAALAEAAALRTRLSGEMGTITVTPTPSINAEALRAELAAHLAALGTIPLPLHVNPSLTLNMGAVRSEILSHLASLGTIAAPIHINPTLTINTAHLQSQLTAALHGLSPHATPITIPVHLDTAQALHQATLLRQQIMARLHSITATISATLNVSSHVTSLLDELLIAIRNLTAAIRGRGGGGGGGGGSGGGGILGSFGGLGGLAALGGGYLGIQGIKSVMAISDEYVNIQSRLNLINDGLQTTDQLQDKIFAAAARARGSYTDMAGVIGRMGTLAKDAFSSNDELIAFTELMQKSFRIGGSSTQEQQAGMYQLSQALSSGKLQGDEFRSIMENAPMLAQAIAKYTGKSIGELRKLSAEGGITSNIIIGSMFGMSKEIEEKFNGLPRTFGDAMNDLKRVALQSFGPVITQINTALNSPEGKQAIENLSNAIQQAAVYAGQLLNAMGNVYGFITDNWSIIEPILWGVVGAIGAWTLAQWALNIALDANPIGLIIMGIATYIGAIVAAVKWVYNLWKTNDDFAAGVYRVWNAILNYFDSVPVWFQQQWNQLVDGFQSTKVFMLQIAEDLVNGIIDKVNWLYRQLGKITGDKFQLDRVDFAAEAAAKADIIKKAGADKLAKMQADAAAKAAEREQNVLDFLDHREEDRAKKEAEKSKKEAAKNTPIDYSKFDVGKVDEVGKIDDKVDISNEDLKAMRELAEMKNIQNFVSLNPIVNVTTGNIMKEVDVDTLITRIGQAMDTEIQASAQGAYG